MKDLSICVIGNSHAAAIKQAWSNRTPGSAGGVSLTFFCAKAVLMRSMELRGGALVPTDPALADMFRYTSGGHDRIEIARYDAFILIGLGFRFSLIQICDNCGTIEHTKWGPIETIVSKACFNAMIQSHLESMALDLMADIRKCTDRPILICPTPFRTEEDLRENLVRRNPRLAEPEFCAALMDDVEAIGSALVARHNGEVVWQDENTVSLPGFTQREFSFGAVRFSEGDAEAGDADGMHMNEDYGRIMLAAALARLDAPAELGGAARPVPPAPAETSEKERRRSQKREDRKRIKRERRRA